VYRNVPVGPKLAHCITVPKNKQNNIDHCITVPKNKQNNIDHCITVPKKQTKQH